MLRDLKFLYVAISDNAVEAFETNLKDFCRVFLEKEPECRNYFYYFREFKKTDKVEFENSNGKKYVLQKVIKKA